VARVQHSPDRHPPASVLAGKNEDNDLELRMADDDPPRHASLMPCNGGQRILAACSSCLRPHGNARWTATLSWLLGAAIEIHCWSIKAPSHVTACGDAPFIC
jgi:hypothetical protein